MHHPSATDRVPVHEGYVAVRVERDGADSLGSELEVLGVVVDGRGVALRLDDGATLRADRDELLQALTGGPWRDDELEDLRAAAASQARLLARQSSELDALRSERRTVAA